MPRELIYPLPNPDGTDADCRVEVGWDRHGAAQIATTVLQQGADRDSEFYDPTGLGPNIAPPAGRPTAESPQPSWSGRWVDLNREQINELIRTLRKARDQAFGRDE